MCICSHVSTLLAHMIHEKSCVRCELCMTHISAVHGRDHVAESWPIDNIFLQSKGVMTATIGNSSTNGDWTPAHDLYLVNKILLPNKFCNAETQKQEKFKPLSNKESLSCACFHRDKPSQSLSASALMRINLENEEAGHAYLNRNIWVFYVIDTFQSESKAIPFNKTFRDYCNYPFAATEPVGCESFCQKNELFCEGQKTPKTNSIGDL